MQKLKNFYFSAIILMLFLIRLGTLQNAFGEDTSSTTSTIASHKHNITSEGDLHSIVNTRFMKEMTTLLFWLPEMNQCNILAAVSKTTRCSVSDIVELLSNLTEIKHIVNVSCPVEMSMKYKTCSHTIKSSVEMISIGNELLKVFDALPAPFKCHVINTIALVYHLKSRRHLANKYTSLALTVTEAKNQFEKMYPSVSLPQTCAKMEENLVIPSIPPVNITVNLTNGDKIAWLKHLSKKGPDIFRTVLEYKRDAYHKDVLRPGSTQQYLEENKELIDSTQFVLVSVQGGRKVFSVLFRIKAKRKQSNHLREMKSTYKIVQALAAKNQKELRTIFNATIIAVSLSGERSNSTKTPPKENRWTLNKISKALHFFPAHLSEYYKQLGKPARCFVVFYISKKMKKSPKEMEMFYNSYKLFSRKHTCYYTWRAVLNNTITIPKAPNITHERNTVTTGVPTLTVTGKIEVPSKGNESAMDNISEKVVSEDLSTLEITLFILLGLLCVAILAFTVNCATSALKAKPKYQNSGAPDGVNIQNAVFLKSTNTAAISNSENGGVQFVDRIQRNGRHIQPPHINDLPTGKYNISVNKLSNLYSAPQCHRGSACNDKRTCSEHFHDSDRKYNTTNTRTQKQNEYCFGSPSQLHRNDNNVMESPWKKRFPCKITCHRTRKEVLDHSVRGSNRDLESQGRAISYCSISDTNSKAQPHRTVHPGSLPSEEVHETLVVMLDCKEIKEEQV